MSGPLPPHPVLNPQCLLPVGATRLGTGGETFMTRMA